MGPALSIKSLLYPPMLPPIVPGRGVVGHYIDRCIIATVEVCGCQGIALRGHRDDSKHLEDMDSLLKF